MSTAGAWIGDEAGQPDDGEGVGPGGIEPALRRAPSDLASGLGAKVLVLNKMYMAVRVTTARRALG